MDTMQQVETVVKQAQENQEAIEEKMSWFQEKLASIQDEIDNIKTIYSRNTDKFRAERIQKLLTKKGEVQRMADEYKRDAVQAAENWLNEQKKILLNKLAEMVATMLKAKTL